jgi:predicted nucleotidyltransferase component of viral defense system
MDLSKLSNLTREENFEVASVMHAMILDELIRCTDWVKTDAIFHGGTSLSIVRNSARFSEDLDFMITEECAEGLETAMRKVRERISITLAVQYPGGKIDLRGPKGKEVCQWLFVWEHPNRRGTVQVKTEFLLTKRSLLAEYASTHVVPNSGRPVAVRSNVPVPVLVSAWADKIKAIATRSAFKWRDAYDLTYIARSMDRENLDDEAKLRAVRATAGIYGTSMIDIAQGLERVVDAGTFTNILAYEADMKRWFDAETFESRKKRDLFVSDLERARDEVNDAIDIVKLKRVTLPGLKR